MLDLTLIIINKGNAGVCPGESARDTIDDLCQIIGNWQDKVTYMYNQNLPREKRWLFIRKFEIILHTNQSGIQAGIGENMKKLLNV